MSPPGISVFLDDHGILLGPTKTSTIANMGLFEKSAGAGVSGVAAAVVNSGDAGELFGTLDFEGANFEAGKDIVSGASTLEFESSVAAGQTVSFTGSGSILKLLDPNAFSGALSGFDTVGTERYAAARQGLDLRRIRRVQRPHRGLDDFQRRLAACDGAVRRQLQSGAVPRGDEFRRDDCDIRLT